MPVRADDSKSCRQEVIDTQCRRYHGDERVYGLHQTAFPSNGAFHGLPPLIVLLRSSSL